MAKTNLECIKLKQRPSTKILCSLFSNLHPAKSAAAATFFHFFFVLQLSSAAAGKNSRISKFSLVRLSLTFSLSDPFIIGLNQVIFIGDAARFQWKGAARRVK